MKKYSKNIPDGTSDIIFDKALYIKKAVDGFRKIYEELGYREIITPTIEYYDVFDFTCQPIVQEMMYKFSDNNGRLLVLRPDGTTPISRVVSTKLREEEKPIKIFYNQNVFRINTDYSGKKNEQSQSGIEIIGVDGLKADILYIETALQVLKSTGLNFKLEIGHMGFYKAIVDSLNLSDKDKETIRLYIESKNTNEIRLDVVDVENSPEKIYDIIRIIPQLFGSYEVIDKARILAGGNEEALAALDYLYKLYNVFDKAGYSENIIIDLGIVHEIDYYTGCVISGYVEGIGENVLSGGRYNNLIANFGIDLPATGFAVNVNLIAKALENAGMICETPKADEIIHYSVNNYCAVIKYIKNNKDKKIEISCFDELSDTMAYAKKNGIDKIVEI